MSSNFNRMQTFGEEDNESTPTKLVSQTKNLPQSLTLQHQPESIDEYVIIDLDHELGKHNDKTNVSFVQEVEESPEKHAEDKMALIEISDVEGDDVDFESQGDSQSSNTNIRKIETFASSGVERLETTQFLLKVQSIGKPAKKSGTQVFKLDKN